MVQLALAVAGSYLGGAAASAAGYAAGATVAFGLTGQAIGFAVGSAIGGVLGQRGAHTVQPGLGDKTVQASTYGAFKTRLYGTRRIAGNVIDGVGEVREVVTTTRVGKGGPKSTNTTRTWNADLAIDLCQAGLAGIRKVWLGGKLVYDVSTGASASSIIASSIKAASFKIYDGSEFQLPDPTLEALHGVGNVPAYRGRSYIVIGAVDCPNGQIPQLHFECSMSITASATLPALTPAVPFAPEVMFATSTYTIISRVCGPDVVYHMVANGGDGGAFGFSFSAQGFRVGNGYKQLLWSATLADYGTGAYSRFPGCNGSHKRPLVIRAGIASNGVFTTVNTLAAIDLLTGQEHILRQFIPGTAVYDIAPNSACYDEINDLICVMSTSDSGRTYERFNPGIYQIPTGLIRRIATLNSTVGYSMAAYNGVVYFLDLRAGVTYVQRYSALTGAYIGETGGGPSLDITTQEASQDPATLVSAYGWVTVVSAHAGGVFVYSKTLNKSWRIDGAWLEISNTVPNSPTTTSGVENCHIEQDYVVEGPLTSSVDGICTYRVASHKSFDPLDITVGSVINDICQTAGLASGEVDVSLLSADTLRGYALTTQASGRAGIEPLLQAFFIDSREQDSQVQFVNRATQTSVATIAYDELASYEAGGEAPDPLPLSRANQAILPRSVSVSYIDQDGDYQTGTQVARRQTVDTDVDQSSELPIAITAARAATVAEVLLYDAWSARNGRSAMLQRKYAYLSPGDVVTVEFPQGTYTQKRITHTNDTGLLVQLDLVDAQALLYSSSIVGTSMPVGQASPTLVPPTRLALLDIPILRDVDDSNGLYAVMAGYTTPWGGGVLYKGADDSTLAIVGSVTAGSNIGIARTTLANWTQNTVDGVNTVTVEEAGTLASCTLDDAYTNGTNLCQIGDELLQYLTATYVSAGKYTLSNLVRGRRGTERYRASHAANERFVAIPAAGTGIVRVALDLGEIGQPRNYRAISLGLSADSQSSTAFTSIGMALKPLQPVNLKRSVLNGASTLTWDRRSRLSGEFPDGADIALGEASELYYVDVYSDATYTLIIRTLSTNTTRAIYTLAQQTVDFGGYQLTLYLRISQVSALVGRGVEMEATSTVDNVNSTPPSLLAHMDGAGVITTPIDSSAYAYAGALVGSAVLSDTIAAAFGASSLYSPGTGSGAEQGCRFATASASHSFGTGDFTITYRFHPVAASNNFAAFSIAEPGPGLPGAGSTAIYITHQQTTQTLFVQMYDGAGAGVTITTASGVFVIGAMNHLALVRRSGVLYLFLGGVQVGTVAAAHSANYTASMTVNVGCWNGGSTAQTYFDEVMVLKGEALYFSAFTPPTEPY